MSKLIVAILILVPNLSRASERDVGVYPRYFMDSLNGSQAQKKIDPKIYSCKVNDDCMGIWNCCSQYPINKTMQKKFYAVVKKKFCSCRGTPEMNGITKAACIKNQCGIVMKE